MTKIPNISFIYYTFTVLFLANTSFADTFLVHSRDRPPELVLKQNNNVPHGPIYELTETLLNREGHIAEWQKTPWIRSFKDAEVGRVDLMIRHTMTPEREKFLLPMLTGFRNRKISFLAPVSKDINITSFDDLLHYEIWATRGSLYSEKFDEDERIKRKDVSDKDLLFKMLLHERIEVVVTSDIRIFESLARKHGFKPEEVYRIMPYSFSSLHGRYFSIPKSSLLSKYYHKINCELFNMRRNGEVSKFFENSNLAPYIQAFDHPESQKQANSCDLK